VWHGNKAAFSDSDAIVISSDSESERKPRLKKEEARLRLKEPTVSAKPRGKVRNRAIPVVKTNAMPNIEALDRGSFFQESETAYNVQYSKSVRHLGDLRSLLSICETLTVICEQPRR